MANQFCTYNVILAKYLRTFPLKPHGFEMLLYDGSIITNHNIYVAVIDMKIGNKDLQQYASAVVM